MDVPSCAELPSLRPHVLPLSSLFFPPVPAMQKHFGFSVISGSGSGFHDEQLRCVYAVTALESKASDHINGTVYGAKKYGCHRYTIMLSGLDHCRTTFISYSMAGHLLLTFHFSRQILNSVAWASSLSLIYHMYFPAPTFYSNQTDLFLFPTTIRIAISIYELKL